MSYKLREANYGDVGKIAYLILVWDTELPLFLRMLHGDAALAHRAAELMCSADFTTWVVEHRGEVVGGLAVHRHVSLFGLHPYGSVSALYVSPKHRGGTLLGLRLLRKAVELKHTNGWKWLEMNPWADDANTHRVLERLGFDESIHTYIKR